jgi:hypothetical protein
MRRLPILGLILLCLCSILPCIHRLLHRVNTLISLRIETRIHRRLCIFELLSSLQRRVLGLLPRRNIGWWGYVYAGHRVRVRRHVGLHALAREGWRDVRRLLLVGTEDGVWGLLRYGGCWTRIDTCLLSAVY